ncbi:XdhC family protein [Paenibacillus tarimensis]|uniref:XdhC family protein n=1 Tax=Paenibacillus tarimensis TaxID=416012 RepID=UPI001F1847B3|nr:XdhC/CoxI family protein [Paenibacillus tarimensis]MCF2944734.1 XdhC family protein [Paenibacillus tarimensis]
MDELNVLECAAGLQQPAVMATIVRAVGHSYRKEGASMLLLQGGSRAGSISPGCLEQDLQERVQTILAAGKPCHVVYNMDPVEDALWGEAVGCGGALTVLLEPVAGELHSRLQRAFDVVSKGVPVRLMRRSSEQAGDICYSLAIGGPALRNSPADLGRGGGVTQGMPLLDTLWMPKERLIIFGGGEDTVPVSEAAVRIGFRVITADWREGVLQARRARGEEVIAGSARDIVLALEIRPTDYILICSHNLARDKEMLAEVLKRNPQYIGLLGSAKRVGLLLDGLMVRHQVIHAPVGLLIGAEGAEEIAVSIAAELVSVRSAMRSSMRKGVERSEGGRIISGGRLSTKNGFIQAAR